MGRLPRHCIAAPCRRCAFFKSEQLDRRAGGLCLVGPVAPLVPAFVRCHVLLDGGFHPVPRPRPR